MLIYEVNLEVADEINFKVAAWLSEHINKMLTFKGFKIAQWFFRKPEDEGRDATDVTLWTIQYLVEDRPSLDEYFSQHAVKVREEAEEKFGDKLVVTRRVLQLLSVAGYPAGEGPTTEPKT